MLKITCDHCKQESVVNMYFFDPIIKIEDSIGFTKIHSARISGRTTCPNCGYDILKHFSCPISYSDIVDLALRREVHI